MDGRDDALGAAAEYVLRVRDAAPRDRGAVATVGRSTVEPGAVNVDPRPGARFTSTSGRPTARSARPRSCGRLGLEADRASSPSRWPTRPMAPSCARARAARVSRSSSSPRAPATTRASWRAQASRAAMLFVRSLNGGASHSPQEELRAEDVELAVDVLAGALARLAEGPARLAYVASDRRTRLVSSRAARYASVRLPQGALRAQERLADFANEIGCAPSQSVPAELGSCSCPRRASRSGSPTGVPALMRTSSSRRERAAPSRSAPPG